MSLLQLTLPVIGCIKCGPDGPALTIGDQVRLTLDQTIVAGLPPYIFGIVQTPITPGQLIHPETRVATSGTYYTIEYQSNDLLGKISELEHCFVEKIECVSNAEVLTDRMQSIEECLLRLAVTVRIHEPVPAPIFNIVSNFVEITYLDKAGDEHTTSFGWNPEIGNKGPFTFYPEYGASLISVAFSDSADTDAGYSLSATSLLSCSIVSSPSGILSTTTPVVSGAVSTLLDLPLGAVTSDLISAVIIKQVPGGSTLALTYVDLTGAAPRAYFDSAVVLSNEFAVKALFA